MGEVFSIDGLHPSNSYGIQPKPLVNGTFNLTSLSLEEREHHLVIKCTKELDQLWLGSIVYLPADTGSGTGLSKGTVAGVVVGVVGFIILLAALLVWLWKRRMKRLRREHVITPFGHPLASASNVLASEIQDSSITSLTTLHRKSPLPQAQPTLQTPTPFPHRQMSSPAPPPYPGHTNRK
ncbi:hypothetical protein Moror_6102 [Moniliophthora roreri MCA 2997]|nr:hypothetical protein Moror_6102 [Moniliophthora roreri MCA 2997]